MRRNRTRPQRLRRAEYALVAVALLGLAATGLCIVMDRSSAYEQVPWEFLIALIGIPSALVAAFTLFVHALEESSQ